MKASAALLSIGLLSSALTAVTVVGHLAWNSLTEVSESAPTTPSRSTVATAPTAGQVVQSPQVNQAVSQVSPAPTAAPASNASNASAAASNPLLPAVNSSQNPAPIAPWTQQENDYLFDLSQALQPVEHHRLSAAEQLQVARNIQAWVTAGADYWGVREQFDRTYRRAIAGDYAHNRDVYIRFATAYFAPELLARVMQPPRVVQTPPGPPPSVYPGPYPVDPYADSYLYPYLDPYLHYSDIPDPGSPYPNEIAPNPGPNQAPQTPQLPNLTEVAL